MPTKKTTRPERPRRAGSGPAVTSRPTARPGATRGGAIGPANRPPQKNDFWKTVRENFGWGLVIGLPIILVILALLFRATNGFDFRPQPTPFPTIAPTPTAGVFQAPAAPPANAQRNRILYLSQPDPAKANQIFTANPDGSDPQQLTFTNESKSAPVWSPDGKQIAFTASGVGIQLINWDGQGLHTLAYNGFSPVWSPDSKQIAFLRQEAASDGRGPDGSGSVRFMYVTQANAKAGDEKQLAYDALGPVWSPNNQDIAYFSLRNLVMFTVRASGGKPTQIKVPAGVGGWFPTFTPDGNSVVFYGSQNANYLASSLDQNTTFLTPTPTTAPTFTPLPNTTPTTPIPTSSPIPTATGTPLGSPTPVGGYVVNLYQVNLDGSNFKPLTELENNNGQNLSSYLAAFISNSGEASPAAGTQPFYKVAPVLSPDGKKVAVISTAKDAAGITVVTLDGSTPPLKIGDGLAPGLRINPVFTPDGGKIVYLFQPNDRGGKIGIKAYDLNAKTEANFAPEGALAFPNCCGYKK